MPRVALLAAAAVVVAVTAALVGPVRGPHGRGADAAVRARRSDGPAQQPTATPGAPPNLVVSGWWRRVGLETASGNLCVQGTGTEQRLRVCVANDGETASGPFTIAADTAPDTPLATTGGLLPGETLCLPVDVPSGVGIVADGGEVVAETNEADNWLPPVPVPTLEAVAYPTCVPHATPLAELDGTGFAHLVTPYGCYRPGIDEGEVGLRVANSGERAAEAFRVAAIGALADSPSWRISELPSDATRSLRNGFFTSQSHIDPDGAVPEHRKDNNDIFVPIPTAPPECTPGPAPTPMPAPELGFDWAMYSVTEPGESCMRDPSMRLYVRIRNVGTAPAHNVDVRTDVPGFAWHVDRLDAGQAVILGPRPEFAPSGRPRYVRIDPARGDDPSNNAVRLWDRNGTPTPVNTSPPLCTAGTPSTPTATPTSPTPVSPVPTSTSTPTSTPTPTSSPDPNALPNLYGTGSSTILEPGAVCLRPGVPWRWRAQFTVFNGGGSAAGPFVVERRPDGYRWAVDALSAGASADFTAGPSEGGLAILIDADHQVAESDEGDNWVRLPTGTLPPTCAADTPGAPPTATGTPNAPGSQRVFLPWAEREGADVP